MNLVITNSELKGKKKRRKTEEITFTGNGVAISKNRALTAVHRNLDIGTVVHAIDRHGRKLRGTLSFVRYQADLVDIAVIELDEGLEFQHFTPYATTEVKLRQKITVLGLIELANGSVQVFSTDTQVNIIEDVKGSTLFYASYYSQEGLSGASILTINDGDGFKVVGVHVAAQSNTVKISPAKKKAKINERLNKLEKDAMTINIDRHAKGTYCIICEVARVEGLIDYLQGNDKK